MPSPTEITVTQLSRLIGTPNAPVIIDVSMDDAYEADPRMIPTAIRHPYQDARSLLPRLAGQRAVVVCHKGLKLSQGFAAILRTHGVSAETLEGGNVAWKAAGEPVVPAARLPKRAATGETVWVTRQRPKIDRIACPWLIRRFVDREARFLFVAPSEVLAVAERFDATPFDIEGVFWSHRGERCTFDTMIEEFGLRAEPLARLAAIVRGADTNRHDLAPEAAGLLAASLGLSRMFKDDIEQLDRGMLLYDAFYRWSRDAAAEGHDWPAASVRTAN
jgi:rhodanese-related sulfurtransferase